MSSLCRNHVRHSSSVGLKPDLKQDVLALVRRLTAKACQMMGLSRDTLYRYRLAVVFLYSPNTTLASVAVLNMAAAGDIAPAAAMG